jgi:hypothetical protein
VSSSLTIVERPPLGLSALVRTPNNVRTRWGWDDPNPTLVPTNLTFGTAMPGGFTQCNLTLERLPERFYPDNVPLSMLTVLGAGGEVAWQGRIEKLPDTGGFEAQESPEAVGYQAALEDDNSAREIYVDAELAKWLGAPLARKILLLGTLGHDEEDGALGSGSGQGGSSMPAFVTQLTGPWARPRSSEGWYDAQGISIGFVYYAWSQELTWEDTNWEWTVYLSGNESLTEAAVAAGAIRSVGPGSGTLDATSALQRYAAVQLYYDTGAGEDGHQYPVYWPVLAVYGRHGLTLYGTNSQTEWKGLLASDVVAHAVGKWAPEVGFSTGLEGTIQPSSFVIPQLAFLEPTTASEIIKQATRFELQDWAVWEGPTFYMNPRGERGNKWKARVGPSQLQETGPQISRQWNGVCVQYTDVAGQTRMVGPPGFAGGEAATEDSGLLNTDPENPLNELGIRKWALLKMGTTTLEGAKTVGRIFLREQGEMETSGQATLTGYVESEQSITYPAWMVRAGDTIRFVDASDTSPRRIVNTSYDDSSKANTIQLDQPPETMQALLERLSVAISNVTG